MLNNFKINKSICMLYAYAFIKKIKKEETNELNFVYNNIYNGNTIRQFLHTGRIQNT